MLPFIKSLLPRLQNLSKTLDHNSLYIDKPWVMIDDNGNYHHYSFQKDGRLIMSLNGDAQIGAWEYLIGSKCILIDRGKDKILLNQLFIYDGIMFLRKDGLNDDFWILINKDIIPDLNYVAYMRILFIKTKHLKSFTNSDNKKYYYKPPSSPNEAEEYFDEDLSPIKDRVFTFIRNDLNTQSDTAVFMYEEKYFSHKNEILLCKQKYLQISLGDVVLVNNKLGVTGKFYIKDSNVEEIDIAEGKITSFKVKAAEVSPYLIATLIIIIIICFLLAFL